MTTFDGWDIRTNGCAEIFGCAQMSGQDYLAHFRTKGSKNGVRRYQEFDGTWTPLGLRERRIREGFGLKLNGEAGRGVSRGDRKGTSAKAKARTAPKPGSLSALMEKRRKNSVKNLSDEELKKRIERLKMEKEYRDLNKNPTLEAAGKLVGRYMDAKKAKDEQRERQYKMETERLKAMGELTKAKAENQQAKTEFIDSLKFHGKGTLKAKTEYLKAKDQRSKNTIRGALSSTAGNLIRKESQRIINDMGNQSITMKVGRRVKSSISKGKAIVQKGMGKVRNSWNNYRYNLNSGSGPNLN